MFLLRGISGAFPLCGSSSISGNEQLHRVRISLSVWPRVCAGPWMLLNELMMPQEMGSKDASAGSRITCAAYRGPFPLRQLCTTGSLCTCWHELVPWNSLQSWAVMFPVRFCWKEAPKGISGYVSCPELIELSGFRGYQSPLISCHISICVCFDICLWHKHLA